MSFFGNYSLNKQSASGDDISFDTPFGLHLNFGYMYWERISIDLVSNFVQYGETTVGSQDSSIKDNKLRHWNIGIGASYHF